LRHQRDGPFWRDRVQPLSEITTPSFLIGGLQDGYRDNVPDMLMKSEAPIKAIVGPWNHSFPNDAELRTESRMARSGRALVRLLAQGTRYRS